MKSRILEFSAAFLSLGLLSGCLPGSNSPKADALVDSAKEKLVAVGEAAERGTSTGKAHLTDLGVVATEVAEGLEQGLTRLGEGVLELSEGAPAAPTAASGAVVFERHPPPRPEP